MSKGLPHNSLRAWRIISTAWDSQRLHSAHIANRMNRVHSTCSLSRPFLFLSGALVSGPVPVKWIPFFRLVLPSTISLLCLGRTHSNYAHILRKCAVTAPHCTIQNTTKLNRSSCGVLLCVSSTLQWFNGMRIFHPCKAIRESKIMYR